jgi:hypothetical protein
MQITDEEVLLNTTDSPFKNILTTIYHQCLEQFDISVSHTTKTKRSGILGWLHYLITYFLPTAPIWSNLLLGNSRSKKKFYFAFFFAGNLKRHGNTIERIEAWPFDEQRSTANSERRMCILKRTQLGKILLLY